MPVVPCFGNHYIANKKRAMSTAQAMILGTARSKMLKSTWDAAGRGDAAPAGRYLTSASMTRSSGDG